METLRPPPGRPWAALHRLRPCARCGSLIECPSLRRSGQGRGVQTAHATKKKGGGKRVAARQPIPRPCQLVLIARRKCRALRGDQFFCLTERLFPFPLSGVHGQHCSAARACSGAHRGISEHSRCAPCVSNVAPDECVRRRVGGEGTRKAGGGGRPTCGAMGQRAHCLFCWAGFLPTMQPARPGWPRVLFSLLSPRLAASARTTRSGAPSVCSWAGVAASPRRMPCARSGRNCTSRLTRGRGGALLFLLTASQYYMLAKQRRLHAERAKAAVVRGPRKIYILLVGLDRSGKTTFLYRLALGRMIVSIPTVGANKENFARQVAARGGQVRPHFVS